MARHPILYSFRRCPYAIRARIAIAASGTPVELREVVLRQKPPQMLALSPKGTVPILAYEHHEVEAPATTGRSISSETDAQVLDESLDIMRWALQKNDPHNWIVQRPLEENLALIELNDSDFKYWLDRYKYHDRHPEHPQAYYADQACVFLSQLEARLGSNRYLFGPNQQLADIAIFPFVRQFAAVDKSQFNSMGLKRLSQWLDSHIEMPLFTRCMRKYAPWQQGDTPVIYQ